MKTDRSILTLALILSLSASVGWAQAATEYVHVPGKHLADKDLRALLANTTLKKLDLRGVGLTDKHMPLFANLSRLEELRIATHRVTATGYAHLKNLKALKFLGMERTSAAGLPKLFEVIKDLPLVELDISDCRDYSGAGLEKLNCKKTLRILDISGTGRGLTDKGLANLKDFTELRHVSMHNNSSVKEGLKYFEGMTKLETLNVYGCMNIKNASYISLFAKLKHLKSVNMGYCWAYKGKGLVFPASLTNLILIESKSLTDAAFAQLPCRNNLVHVNLTQCLPLTDKGIAVFHDMKQLKSFKASCIRALTNKSLESLSGNTGLTLLDISDNDNFNDEGLAHLKNMAQLESISLWHLKGVTGSGLKSFLGMKNLRELNLADCYNLQDRSFSTIKKLKALESLYLDNCKITDAAIGMLAGNTTLKDLTLSGCGLLTDKSLEHIKTMVGLKYLDISNCAELSDEGVRSIRKALVGCVVVR
jgi:F-box/leucine-rich repeat protein 14